MNTKDLLEQLKSNPDYLSILEKRQEEIKARIEETREIEAPLINELNALGYDDVKDVDDLRKQKKLESQVVSKILYWLPKISNIHNSQEFLVRALILADKPFDGRVLIELFDDPRSSFHLKWAVGLAIGSKWLENTEEWLEKTLLEESLGKEGEMLVYAIPKYFDEEKARFLLRKIFDKFLLHAADAYPFIGKQEDLDFLENKLLEAKGVHKTAIKKAINKIEKKIFKASKRSSKK